MKAVPQIQKFMTTTPQAVNANAMVQEAAQIMEKNGIRHLPVMKDGKVLGIISDRDIRRAVGFTSFNPQVTPVADICETEYYETKPSAHIDEVATAMADEKIGSALVMDNGNLVGIFTTTDVCRALAEIANQRFHK